jgi:hypothetical protein
MVVLRMLNIIFAFLRWFESGWRTLIYNYMQVLAYGRTFVLLNSLHMPELMQWKSIIIKCVNPKYAF